MDVSFLEKVKRLTVIAMVSDDYLLDTFVLKGGNAIDLIYKVSMRASIDVDFAMQSSFTARELPEIERRIDKVLKDTFHREGLTVFDINFVEKPQELSAELKQFWGGYKVEFKVILNELYEKNVENVDFLRRNAAVVGPAQRRKFRIEISKFEYCQEKEKKDLEGYAVYVYTPEMIVLEKIRALCQQIKEYKRIVKTQIFCSRARDFFDIYVLIEHFDIDVTTPANKELLEIIFNTKKVPLSFLKKLRDYRDFHRQDFSSLKDTVNSKARLKDFDFYFDYTIGKFEGLNF